MANKYLESIAEVRKDYVCETPLIWDEKKGEFVEKYPCKTNVIKVE